MKRFNTCWVVIACVIANVSPSCANEGDPVAIRLWPDGGVTIETMWNLHVGYGLTEEAKQQLPRPLDLERFRSTVTKPISAITLGRLPNEPRPSVLTPNRQDQNRVVISCVNAGPLTGTILIDVDGVVIYILTSTVAKAIESVPLMNREMLELNEKDGSNTIIFLDNSFDEAKTIEIAKAIKPKIIVLPITVPHIGDHEVTAILHNTLAVSAAKDSDGTDTQFVSLTTVPYEMSDELADLFSKKETACKNSRDTFAKLSIEQMNFRPPNGTHTPRWNSEHMMGRELLFFSQIYHAVDSSIPVVDLNPRQMPDDYEMAHPDWTGQEEARQTERVESFTRRYAYLLDGIDLDQKAKGSKFWTPRALLKQMERHYNEHTANVRKKMQLNEWPKQ